MFCFSFFWQPCDFGHIILATSPGIMKPCNKGITTMNKLLALIVLGLALMVGAGTTVEVMTLFPDSAAACVNANC